MSAADVAAQRDRRDYLINMSRACAYYSAAPHVRQALKFCVSASDLTPVRVIFRSWHSTVYVAILGYGVRFRFADHPPLSRRIGRTTLIDMSGGETARQAMRRLRGIIDRVSANG